MFCIDASVLISAARGNEPSSARARAFLERVARNQLKVFLPEITSVEVASGLYRATKRPDFVVAFTRALRALPNFAFVSVDSRLAERSIDVMVKAGLRGADAVYVALAMEYGLTLVTLDREQLSKARKLVSVIPP